MIKKWQDKLREATTKVLLKLLNGYLLAIKNSPEEIYLEVELKGVFSNKLFCLFSACKIAIENNYVIVKPHFGKEVL
ncbi:MAG: hypothetical protein Q8Q51_06745 [Lutibacter sp.]|nr:hypothetical protein [Lutibacter sp.]